MGEKAIRNEFAERRLLVMTYQHTKSKMKWKLLLGYVYFFFFFFFSVQRIQIVISWRKHREKKTKDLKEIKEKKKKKKTTNYLNVLQLLLRWISRNFFFFICFFYSSLAAPHVISKDIFFLLSLCVCSWLKEKDERDEDVYLHLCGF